jgi:transposase
MARHCRDGRDPHPTVLRQCPVPPCRGPPRGKRAQTAVAHSLLVAAWHILATRTPYHDLGGDYFLNRDNPDHRHRRAIAQLERLGYQVTLEPRAA